MTSNMIDLGKQKCTVWYVRTEQIVSTDQDVTPELIKYAVDCYKHGDWLDQTLLRADIELINETDVPGIKAIYLRTTADVMERIKIDYERWQQLGF